VAWVKAVENVRLILVRILSGEGIAIYEPRQHAVILASRSETGSWVWSAWKGSVSDSFQVLVIDVA
jgi:hypothetical protein